MTIWLLICNPVGCRAPSGPNLRRLEWRQRRLLVREVPTGAPKERLEVVAVLPARSLAAPPELCWRG